MMFESIVASLVACERLKGRRQCTLKSHSWLIKNYSVDTETVDLSAYMTIYKLIAASARLHLLCMQTVNRLYALSWLTRLPLVM